MTTRRQHGEFYGVPEIARDAGGFKVSIASADPCTTVGLHTHDDAHFVLLLDGHYLSAARGAGHLHAEPALIYNPPGTTHRDAFPDRHGRFLAISLSRARFAEAAQVATPSDAALRVWDPDALAAAQRIASEHDPLALEALCLELVATWARRVDHRPPRWLVRARESLHDRSCEPLTIRDVAADAGVHPVHLAREFRRAFGCTPAEYVRHLRVERAALLARTTSRPLAEIAAACGFVDQSHLTRAFARRFATSPGAYRMFHAYKTAAR